jgi:hypothetical protein
MGITEALGGHLALTARIPTMSPGICTHGRPSEQPLRLPSLSGAGSYLVQTLSSRRYSIWLSTSFVYVLHTIWPPSA